MGNSQSIDLIVDPANQSEITDVSVLGFFSLFFFLKKFLWLTFKRLYGHLFSEFQSVLPIKFHIAIFSAGF